MKKVVVIGAGVAGLAAATYLQSSGFDVTIYEQHIIPGGLSTSWSRKGYLFEGGMHWLTGSSPALTLNRIWKEVGALQQNNPIYNRDPIYTLVRGDRQLRLFRDEEKLRKEFLQYAPEDKNAINKLCSDIKKFKNVHLVIEPTLGELIKMIPAGIPTLLLQKQSYLDYVAKFKNEDIRHLLLSVIGTRYNALSFVYTLGSFASGDCGYPEGGSLRLTQNMADTFLHLGGKICYKTRVTKIVQEKNSASGVYIANATSSNNVTSSSNIANANTLSENNGDFVPADIIVVSKDTRSAIDNLFAKPLDNAFAKKMRAVVKSEQNMFICLGVKKDLSRLPRCFVLPLEKEFEAAGLKFGELRINNYAEVPGHAPDGCTALTCLLLGDSYAWWKACKENGTYKQEKENIVQRFIECVSKFVPELDGNIEVTDLATPLTYERYTGSFEGSWMSVWDTTAKMFTFPCKTKNMSNVYFASERMMMPGGLPIAVWSGRRAAQAVCKDTKVKFIAPK